MIQAEWKGLDAFKRRLTTMKRRVKPEVASLLRGVSDASARAALKAAKGHRKTGRLQASIKPHTTETTSAGFSCGSITSWQTGHSPTCARAAEAAANVEVKRGGEKLLRNLTK